VTATARDATSPLRRDVRLLGDVLGRVLAEQVGADLVDDVEKVRRLARDVRAGEAPGTDLASAVAALPAEREALVLRAFALYFQLANLAEQHHRLRRWRAYRAEAEAPRESLAEAFGRLAAAGIAGGELRRGAAGVSLELVVTAHPTEATRRGTLAAHLRLSGLLDEVDAGEPVGRGAAALAEEITVLWQTDEVRSRRPRVVDEIRQALWFFERSLLDAAEVVLAEYRRRLPGAPLPLRFGS
jgi:phosphoenolpyruvate carboxylase